MNAVFDVINPGTHEVLAQVSEMGYDEVNDAVQAGYRAFNSGWKDTPVEERIELMMKLVELFERDQEVLMACEILNGGKVSELAQGDLTHFRLCEYFADVARSIQFGDGETMHLDGGMKAYSYVEPWGVVAGIIPGTIPLSFQHGL